MFPFSHENRFAAVAFSLFKMHVGGQISTLCTIYALTTVLGALALSCDLSKRLYSYIQKTLL